MTTPFDSTADTLRHSLRVAELMGEPIKELIDRSVRHDLSKTREPELATYNQFAPRLREAAYGTAEHAALVAAMGEGLRHHYAHNRHHPEHFPDGFNGMTLVDLIEMLAAWGGAPRGGHGAGRGRRPGTHAAAHLRRFRRFWATEGHPRQHCPPLPVAQR